MKRAKSLSINRQSRLQIVPWFNKKEWKETYQQAYSENVELQEKAYTQMCIWKARFANLPLGVECTMSVLHVKLCDKQTEDSTATTPYKHRDLQLLYSTAVMRFLNHLTVLSSSKDSMYKMAQQNQIPDWLINLRHEAAHGNSVPALYLLRQASEVILQWLKDHYWDVEDSIMTDVVSDGEKKREDECRRITELLELWLVLKVHYWARCRTIDKIPNEVIRKRAMELANEEGVGIRRSVVNKTSQARSPMNLNETNDSIGDEEQMDVGEENTVEYTHKIKTAFEPLLRRLFDPLKEKNHIKIHYQECLIDCLVRFEGFCPLIDLENLSEIESCQLTWLLGHLWKEVVEGLQAHSLLHCLLSRLMSADEQVSTTHLWLRLITQLLSNKPIHPPRRQGIHVVCHLLAEGLPCDIEPKLLPRKLKVLQSPLELKPPSAKDIEELQQLACKAIYKPTQFTSGYLNDLLRYWEDGLSDEGIGMLCELTKIFNGTLQFKGQTSGKVYTTASLIDEGLVLSDVEDSDLDNILDTTHDTSTWSLYSGDADWSRCALGTLPWQC